MLRFGVHPAQLTVGEGVRAAWSLFTRTWEIWVPIVVILAISQTLLSAALGHLGNQSIAHVDPTTNQLVFDPDALNRASGVLFLGALVSVVNLVATWFFTATAIHALRGGRSRPVGSSPAAFAASSPDCSSACSSSPASPR